jgi:hypothetical protein
MVKGTSQVLLEEFKEADKTLRIQLGKEADKIKQSMLLNNLACNQLWNKDGLTERDHD